MTKLIELIEMAKANSATTEWPYGEAYYKAVVARFNPKSKRTTFTLHYKAATKKQVEEYLNSL